jgi:hypothetical protein
MSKKEKQNLSVILDDSRQVLCSIHISPVLLSYSFQWNFTIWEVFIHGWLAPLLWVCGEAGHHGDRKAWWSRATNSWQRKGTRIRNIIQECVPSDLLHPTRTHLLITHSVWTQECINPLIKLAPTWSNHLSTALPGGTKPSTHECVETKPQHPFLGLQGST